MRTAIQLYTLRDIDESILDIIARVGETEFDGVEFANRVGEESPADVRQALDDAGLVAPSAHVGIEALENDLAGSIETARVLGSDDIVIPWLDPKHFETVAAVEETATRLSDLASAVADEGLRLHYHNHEQEFAETDEGIAFDLLAEQTGDDLFFQVDAGWAMVGGVNPATLLRRYADRITLVHCKDETIEGDAVPAFGEGDLDIDAVAEATHDIGAEWAIFENDKPEDPIRSLRDGATLLARTIRNNR